MIFQLLGFLKYGFTDDNGKYISGYKFHVARQSTNPDFQGSEVANLPVSDATVKQCGDPQVGVVYEATYNQKGRLVAYHPQQRQTKIPNA